MRPALSECPLGDHLHASSCASGSLWMPLRSNQHARALIVRSRAWACGSPRTLCLDEVLGASPHSPSIYHPALHSDGNGNRAAGDDVQQKVLSVVNQGTVLRASCSHSDNAASGPMHCLPRDSACLSSSGRRMPRTVQHGTKAARPRNGEAYVGSCSEGPK